MQSYFQLTEYLNREFELSYRELFRPPHKFTITLSVPISSSMDAWLYQWCIKMEEANEKRMKFRPHRAAYAFEPTQEFYEISIYYAHGIKPINSAMFGTLYPQQQQDPVNISEPE